MANDDGPADAGEDDLVANRRQLVRLAVQRRPDLSLDGLHRTLQALEVDTDESTLVEDLAALDIDVEDTADGSTRLVGPGIQQLDGAGTSGGGSGLAGLSEQISLKNPAVVAAAVAGAVLVVILLGVLVFRDPGSKSDDAGPAAPTTVSTPVSGGTPGSTKPKVLVAPSGPGSDPALASGDVITTNFDGSDDTLGEVDGIGPFFVGAGSWAREDGHARLTASNPGGPSVAFVQAGSADVRAQVKITDATQGAGIAFHVVDTKNYWLWIASPRYATCTALQVVDGKGVIRGNSGITVVRPGIALGVHTSGKTIELLANGVVVKTLTDDSAKLGSGVGIGADVKTAPASFDDLLILKG